MLTKSTMAEILESDKEIIERQANEILELKQNQKNMENILINIGAGDNYEEFIKFIKFIYDNKNDFMEFLNMKNNNIKINTKDDIKYNIENDKKFISLKNKNQELEQKIGMLKEQNKILSEEMKKIKTNKENINESINIKIKEALDKQNLEFNIKIEEINKSHIDEINNIKSEYEKAKTSLPSPSSSEETKKRKNKINKLPDNLIEVVYYRNVNNNNNLPSYKISNNKKYLNCCNQEHKYKVFDEYGITCSKCYKTYTLNSENKLIGNILPEHIISNEKEILNKIKCNNNYCDKIYKKEIELCNSCKYVDCCKPIITELPNDNVGIRTVKTFASETFNQILFYDKIYNTAKEEKVNVYEMRPLVNFIKKNNLMKEKQPNIIIKKILRSRYILDIYNEDRYKNIQNIAKRIYINLDYLPKLDDEQFNYFKDILYKLLDNEVIKLNIDIKKESKNSENINIKNKVFDYGYENRNCKKCLIPVTKEQHDICDKCINLCVIDECFDKKSDGFGITLEYCKTHANKAFSFNM